MAKRTYDKRIRSAKDNLFNEYSDVVSELIRRFWPAFWKKEGWNMKNKIYREKRYISAKDEIFEKNRNLALELIRRF